MHSSGCNVWKTLLYHSALGLSAASALLAPGDNDPATITSNSIPSGATVVTEEVGTQGFLETFVPTVYSQFISVSSTLTISASVSETSAPPVVVGPGGVAWAPWNQSIASFAPPSVPPNVTASASRVTGGGLTSSVSSSNVSALPIPTFSVSSSSGVTSNLAQTTASSTTNIIAPLPIITTSYDPEAVTEGSINPTITANTAIRTSDNRHPLGLYPFIKGGPSCFFCPPGIDDGGLFLFGMTHPGIFPPPPTPPFPGVRNFPTITIGDDLNPTPHTDDEEQPTSTGASPSASTTGSFTSVSSIGPITSASVTGSTSSVGSSTLSSCSQVSTAYDCSVSCPNATAAGSISSCSTSCYSTITGCSAQGSTTTATASGGACSVLQPLSSISWNEAYESLLTSSTPSNTSLSASPATTLTSKNSSVASPSTLGSNTLASSLPPTSNSSYSAPSPLTGTSTLSSTPPSTWSPSSGPLAPPPSSASLSASPSAVSPSSSNLASSLWSTSASSLTLLSTQNSSSAATVPTPSSTSSSAPPPAASSSSPTPPPAASSSAPPPPPPASSASSAPPPAASSSSPAPPPAASSPSPAPPPAASSVSSAPLPAASSSSPAPPPAASSSSPAPPPSPSPPAPSSAAPAPPPAQTIQCALGDAPTDGIGSTGPAGGLGSGSCQCDASNGNSFELPPNGGCCDSNCNCKTSCAIPGTDRLKGRAYGVDASRPRQIAGKQSRRRSVWQEASSRAVRLERTRKRSFAQSLSDKAPSKREDSTWETYAAKGATNYQKWQDKTGADKPDLCNFNEEFAWMGAKQAAMSKNQDILKLYQSLGMDTSIQSWSTMVVWPKDPPQIGDYSNMFNPQNGLIDARTNQKRNAGKENPIHLSDIFWYLWQRACLDVTPGTTDFSGLKWVFRSSIDNPDTTQILFEVFKDKPRNTPLRFTPDDPDQKTNAFWALLGSPNGYAANRMCTDHKQALNGKGVKSMNAMTTTNGDMFMWAEIA